MFVSQETFASSDIHLEPRGLAQMSCGSVFKPSIHGGQFSGHDEILISESEMQRVFSLGENRVNCLFIKINVVMQASFKESLSSNII